MSFINNIFKSEKNDEVSDNILDAYFKYPEIMIYESIEQASNKYSNNTAIEYYGKKFNYKELYKKVETVAKSLKKMGIKEKERITICSPNTPEAVILFYAVNMVGAVASMIHPLSSVNEIEYYMEVAESKYVLTVNLFADKVIKAARKIKGTKIIVSDVLESMNSVIKFAYNVYNKFLKNKEEIIIPNDDDIILWKNFYNLGHDYKGDYKYNGRYSDEAVILYSGGTTGKPKGIRLSNMNFNALGIQCFTMTGAKSGNSALVVLPIFHGFGLGVSVHTLLMNGMNCVLVPQFNSSEFVKLIKKHKPIFLIGVPTMYEALCEQNDDSNYLAGIKNCICGGDLLTVDLRDRVNEYLKKHGSTAEIRVGYGLSESTAACILTPSNYFAENCIGLPFPGNEAKIVKPGTTKELKCDKVGEICVTGPTVMLGYLNDKEETSRALKVHEDGKVWLHTGDLGDKNKEGYIFFRSRLKRMIVTSGYNVYPTYMEKIIASHPAVKGCVVVGIPHPYKKEVPIACIVLEDKYDDESDITDSIKAYCSESIAKYSMPYRYHYIKTIPKTLLGKINYKKLEEECTKKYEKKS